MTTPWCWIDCRVVSRIVPLPGLAVVLLVGAVVLKQLDRWLAESGSPVGEFLGYVAAEIIARGLRDLDGGGLGGGCGSFVGHRGVEFLRQVGERDSAATGTAGRP